MPDVGIKVVRGAWPEGFAETLRPGDKVLWLPDVELRKIGCCPMLSIYHRDKRKGFDAVSHVTLVPGVMGNG
jgi:hypothetical protein